MKIYCLQQHLLYFNSLLNADPNSLLGRAFNESCSLHTAGKFSWVSSAQEYLKAFGIETNVSVLRKLTTRQFKFILSRSLRNSFERYWFKKIRAPIGTTNKGWNKLRTYAKFKNRFHCEPYTQIPDRSIRRCLAKFRCSDHRLRIETGRREGIPPESRICQYCDGGAVEDEIHFLTTCSNYEQLRLQLFEHIEKDVKPFVSLSPEEKCIFILSTENLQVIRRVASFIENALAARWPLPRPLQNWPGYYCPYRIRNKFLVLSLCYYVKFFLVNFLL